MTAATKSSKRLRKLSWDTAHTQASLLTRIMVLDSLHLSRSPHVAPIGSLPTEVFGNIFHFCNQSHPRVLCIVAAACLFRRETAILWTSTSIQIRPQNIRLCFDASCSNQAILLARVMEICAVRGSPPPITSSERHRIRSLDVLVPPRVI